MSEINWKYISTQLAQEYQTQNGGRWTKEHLVRTWMSLFEFPISSYQPIGLMGETMGAMYNMFMTLANRESTSDKQKVEDIYFLLETITGGFKESFVQDIFRKGKYSEELPVTSKEKPTILNQALHPEVIKHCGKLFAQGHYSICVNEACKSYNRAVQTKSGSTKDGADLMLSVFGEKGNLRINGYKSDTEINEQEGFKFMSAGLMKGFRNPTAHEPALSWTVSREDCIEILGLASFLFKRLDQSTVV